MQFLRNVMDNQVGELQSRIQYASHRYNRVVVENLKLDGHLPLDLNSDGDDEDPMKILIRDSRLASLSHKTISDAQQAFEDDDDDLHVEARDRSGSTLLLLATRVANRPLIDMLTAPRHRGGSEADLLAVDLRGRSALHVAAERNDVDTMMLLLDVDHRRWSELDYVADYFRLIDVQDCDGNTAVHSAARFGAAECLKWLVEKAGDPICGADFDLLNNNGETVVHVAAKFNKRDLYNYLVRSTEDGGAGMKSDVKNIFGKTAAEYMAYYDNDI